MIQPWFYFLLVMSFLSTNTSKKAVCVIIDYSGGDEIYFRIYYDAYRILFLCDEIILGDI